MNSNKKSPPGDSVPTSGLRFSAPQKSFFTFPGSVSNKIPSDLGWARVRFEREKNTQELRESRANPARLGGGERDMGQVLPPWVG